ncbi:MAG: hypothetical protein RL328_832, partial [Acidobacteriota bacterium]
MPQSEVAKREDIRPSGYQPCAVGGEGERG